MEFWVVAAATGAGYVAKHWQNLSGEKEGSSKPSPVPTRQVQPDVCLVFGKMPDSVFQLPKLPRRCFLDGHVSSSPDEHIKMGYNLQDHDKLAVPEPDPIFMKKELLQEDEISGKRQECFDMFSHRLHEFRSNNQNSKSFSPRPLLVTSNGGDSRRKQDVRDHRIVFMEENVESMEAPFFEPAGSVTLPRRPKGNDMVPLFIGITIGILSTSVTYQREVEHLNELLEQAENMVQDLHTKLEMKEGFTSKEHGDGTMANETATDGPKGENFELISDIEAELEAELERLEENLKGCTLQRSSNFGEVESDYEADMARGDLNLDAVAWPLSQSDSDHSDKTESTGRPVYTPNYAVSSQDLRLRLHQVIESELRSRIEQLESIFQNQNSQSKHCSPDPQEENSFWDFDHTRIESSSSTP